MKRLAVVFTLLFVSVFYASAEYVMTPFGRVWVGPGPEPKAPVAVSPEPAPKLEPFRPTFEQGVTVSVNILGFVHKLPMNEQYFATKETADALCKRLFCSYVFEQPAGGDGGPNSKVSHLERWLAWPDGLKHNAGILAAYYVRNPEDQFPGYADRFVDAILKSLRENK